MSSLAKSPGALAGIGLAAAETLIKLGAKFVACARNIEKIQELNTTLGKDVKPIFAVNCDMTKEKDVLALFKEIAETFEKLDVLIKNAGVNAGATLMGGGATLRTEKLCSMWRKMGDKNDIAILFRALRG
ncbi:hypothetical protein BV898_13053 [Hypsibius exemplaris]|uniref:Uncharacterized protein n=1 Tax=Hypsibius exemplaris TaxID=2072580 RepID=A0A1W0WC45_HYPEX|nr:hypothetical protein BV898_13053 [Hypsibius exemplaris]